MSLLKIGEAEVEVEFSQTPYLPASFEYPEEGGDVEIKAVLYSGDGHMRDGFRWLGAEVQIDILPILGEKQIESLIEQILKLEPDEGNYEDSI